MNQEWIRRTDRLEILLVEDARAESCRLQDTFEKTAMNTTLHAVPTGEAALDVLFQRGEYTSVPSPDIVLLDLPSADALEFLATIESDGRLGRIPVLVVVDGDAVDEIGRYYERGANACLKRTDEYGELVSATESFWCRQVQLPRK